MRKVAFTKNKNEVIKLMFYQSKEGVFLFGFDSLADTACIWDQLYDSIEDVVDYSQVEYGILKENWIEINDPDLDCRHDFILPTKIGSKGYNFEKLKSFGGLTGNERLFISGLMKEFDKTKLVDKIKAKNILTQLKFDPQYIDKILS